MTGQRKNEILPEISQAEEWFDLDRSYKPMENESNADDFIEVTEEEPAAIPICPYCSSSNAEYIGEAYDDDVWEGSAYKCLECDHQFYDIDGTYED